MSKFVDEGENRVADILFGSQAVDTTLYLRLYTNTTEPAEDAQLTDLTEVSGGGYAVKSLSRGSWTITNDEAEYAQQTFEATEAWGNIYGYYIATSSDNSGKLLAVEHFTNGPYNVQSAGDQIKITPKITVS